MENKKLLKQVEWAIHEVERLQSDLDNLFDEEKINIDEENELTRILITLDYLQEKIKEIK